MYDVRPNELSRTVRRAGITQPEAAQLFNVSLVTAHKYIHGFKVSDTKSARVEFVVKILNDLTNAKKLPLTLSSYNEEEKPKREAAIAKLKRFIDLEMAARNSP